MSWQVFDSPAWRPDAAGRQRIAIGGWIGRKQNVAIDLCI
jgi:hypothetical protein